MSKNASQRHRHASTHYHDAARQHQQAAHFMPPVTTKPQRTAQATRPGSNSQRTTKTKR